MSAFEGTPSPLSADVKEILKIVKIANLSVAQRGLQDALLGYAVDVGPHARREPSDGAAAALHAGHVVDDPEAGARLHHVQVLDHVSVHIGQRPNAAGAHRETMLKQRLFCSKAILKRGLVVNNLFFVQGIT